MATTTDVPQIEMHLPEMMDFVRRSAHAFESGALTSWQDLTARVQTFFTPAMLDKVERVAPGWRAMSAYADGITLVHVMCVFTALLSSPEYRRATLTQQALMKWSVLFHDLAKQVYPGRRDHTHAFRSAALTAASLPQLGFATTDAYGTLIDEWMRLTSNAAILPDRYRDAVQDNDRLPSILTGIAHLFGNNSPGALVVKTVLLHQSVTVVADWPQAAPLTETQVRQYLDRDVLPLLRSMMLVDNDGWNMFDRPTKEWYRQETECVFDQIQTALGS